MKVTRKTGKIDHIVVTCQNIEASKVFYGDILEFGLEELGDGRVEVHFGGCKINLQPAGRRYGPPRNANRNWTGNFCIVTEQPLNEVQDQLKRFNVQIEQGPVEKVGANGPINSIYFRDPDQNLIEVSNQM